MASRFLVYFHLSFLSFFRHFLGVIFQPYQTYRYLIKAKYPLEAVFVGCLVLVYIGLSSLLKQGLASPLLLTWQFGRLTLAIFAGFWLMLGLLYWLGRLAGGCGSLRNLFLPWVYSLLPTTFWFLLTSFFYLILPPPRTVSFKGQLFSFLFIAFSLTLFYWKAVLYYLTLRFGHRLNFLQILLVTVFFLPAVIGYSLLTYRLGLFKVPFL